MLKYVSAEGKEALSIQTICRRKGIRTLNLWFWRPLFYRWNYSPMDELLSCRSLRTCEHVEYVNLMLLGCFFTALLLN